MHGMVRAVRWAALATAALRVALGVVAVGRPGLAARPWVGTTADTPAAAVLGRAAGARDIALGTGALLAAADGDTRATRVWTAAGAFCDLLDLVTTLAAWRRLPRSRAIVAAASGGAAVVGALELATGGGGEQRGREVSR